MSTVEQELLRRAHSQISDALVDARRASRGLGAEDRKYVTAAANEIDRIAFTFAGVANELERTDVTGMTPVPTHEQTRTAA